MVAVAVLGELRGDAVEQRVVGEGAQQFEVAFAGLVDAGEDRVDDAEPGAGPMRPRATPWPGWTRPPASAADSSARTTVVPTAMTRRPFSLAMPMAAAVRLGMR